MCSGVVIEPHDILAYWFGPLDAADYPKDKSGMWWKKDPEVDADIATRFADVLTISAEGGLEHWRDSKEGRLAHIILVDQMSRNMHRGSPLMFSQDDLGQELALLSAISGERFDGYHERMFQYMPLMHAENVALQRLCAHLFAVEMSTAQSETLKKAASGNHEFAVRHQEIIERFGRFPHRNEILSRQSTAEEIEFLKEPGSSF